MGDVIASFRIGEIEHTPRSHHVVEQGIPVRPMPVGEVGLVSIRDQSGQAVTANIQLECTNQDGMAHWILVSMPVSDTSGEYTMELGESPPAPSQTLSVEETGGTIVVRNGFFTLSLRNPGTIELKTPEGQLFNGEIDYCLRSDARSTVGGHRPVRYQPEGFTIEEPSDQRLLIVHKGRYLCWVPKSVPPVFDDERYFDCRLEMRIYAFSPVIRLKWRITSYLRWNCPYCWLERYVLRLPLADGMHPESDTAEHIDGRDRMVFHGKAGSIGITAPFTEWLGPGAGIEAEDGYVSAGGLAPPIDAGFGGSSPYVYRMFYFGMSRSFEMQLLVNPTADEISSEMNPAFMVLPPQHYSDTGVLPERGSEVTFGAWEDRVKRAAEWMLKNQWKGTLWWGEWWREWDVGRNMGVEEAHNGNSAVAPLYHFFRTGDGRFLQCAKRSCYFTSDIQLCKQKDGKGPYMHTRRFLLDHQDWFHQRYQRINGIVVPSHIFGDRFIRDEAYWMVREWGSRYVAEDGVPLYPNSDGTMTRQRESAMANFAEALVNAYWDTGDDFFLQTARRIGDWIVRGTSAPKLEAEKFNENWNSTRYILSGMVPLYYATGDSRYAEAIEKISEFTANFPVEGTHFVFYHALFQTQTYRISGRTEVLRKYLESLEECLSKEGPDGTYPYVNDYGYPPARWISYYDNKALTAFLPVLASLLAELGMAEFTEKTR